MAIDATDDRRAQPSMGMTGMLDRAPGVICTFYSYKGGVGRSMTLANVAYLLSKSGKKVLIVDWDLEAPGLERYFARDLRGSRRRLPGVVDLFQPPPPGGPVDWRHGLISAPVPGGERISILHAGLDDGRYLERLRNIDWQADWVGGYLEELRADWQQEYDFVLIDSRTGITDIGGICAIHLPDYLISMFTTTEQSLLGVRDAMQRARDAHADLPLDRKKLLIVPLPSRDESNTEYKLAGEWRRRFASELATFFEDWIPIDEDPERVLDILKIPYVAYWSFGEQLPVATEDATNSKTLAYSYALVARLLNGRLSFGELREGSRTAAEEKQQRDRVEQQAAEAARIREEAKVIEQERLKLELEERAAEQERRHQIAERRLSKIRESITHRKARDSVFYLMGYGVFVLSVLILALGYINPTLVGQFLNGPSAELFPNSGLSLFTRLMILITLVAVSAAIYSYVMFRRYNLAQKVLRNFERLRYEFHFKSGVFVSLASEEALRLLMESAERLLVILYEGSPVDVATVPAASSTGPSLVTEAALSSIAQKSPHIAMNTANSSTAGATTSPPRADTPLDVFISFAAEGVATLWLQEFRPIFAAWLTELIGRTPEIHLSALDLADGGQGGDLDTVSRARLLLCIVTPRYLHSEQPQALKESFLSRNSLSQVLELSLVSDNRLSSARNTSDFDFSDLAFVGEAFARSERYIEFQQRVRWVAERVAEKLDANSAYA